MSILQAKNLTKVYGSNEHNVNRAVDNISLQIEEGEFTAVMGPSGSGKSTLVSMLCGILQPSSGEVSICGEKINEMDKLSLALFRRRKLGFVFQDFNLLDNLTVKENIILPMAMDDRKKEEMEAAADRLMKQFGIYECRDQYPYEISGGQMQRTAVSRALVNQPILIFADEPTGNLDSKSSAAVMKSFATINEETKTAILMVTHDVYAASFCRHVIFIKDGRIHMDIRKKGSRAEFFQQILDCQAVVGGESYEL